MHRRYLLLMLLAALPVYAERPARLSSKQCRAISKNMRTLQSRLRDAHSARQGRIWKRRMRELQLKRYRGCR